MLGARQNQILSPIVELRDVLPTLPDIAGLPIPESVEGKSLLPVIRGDARGVRDYLHGEHTGAEGPQGLGNQFIVTECDKYVWFTRTGREQYFDLERDAYELHDAIRDLACQERVGELRGLLIRELSGREEGYTDGQRLIPGQRQTPCLSHII